MPFKISPNQLQNTTSKFSYEKNGDNHEVNSGKLVTDIFKNSELFWRDYITPMTKRIDASAFEQIRPRESITSDLRELSAIHYSIFLNLVYAEHCLQNQHLSYFENFYAHLGTVCDLVEEFLIQVYLLKLQCEKKQSRVLQQLSKFSYLKLAWKWHTDHYPRIYEFYLNKGKKPPPVPLPSRQNILKEYFGKSKQYKNYITTSNEIRTYRNVAVHNLQIACHIIGSQVYIPKRKTITKYKKWDQVFLVKVGTEEFKNNFNERNIQMKQDMKELKLRLQNLWERPYSDFYQLLYKDKNVLLLSKYDIEFVEDSLIKNGTSDLSNSPSDSGSGKSDTSGKASSSGYEGYSGYTSSATE